MVTVTELHVIEGAPELTTAVSMANENETGIRMRINLLPNAIVILIMLYDILVHIPND